MRRALAALLLLGAAPTAAPTQAPLLLEDVSVLDVERGKLRPRASVLVSGGRIARVGAAGSINPPAGTRVLRLPGRVVTPGFIDMHLHVATSAMRYRRNGAGRLDSSYDARVAERLLRAALAMGITTIRDPGGPTDLSVALRERVARGEVPGPRIFTAGDIVFGRNLTDSLVRAEVDRQADAGVDYLKVYGSVAPSHVRLAVEEAHRRDIPVIGHLQRTDWTEAAAAGIDFITHGASWSPRYLPEDCRARFEALHDMRQRIVWLECLDPDGAAIDTMVAELARRGVSVDPTLVAYHTKFFWNTATYRCHAERGIIPEIRANWDVLGMPTEGWTTDEFRRVQAVWPKALRLTRRLYDAGVLLTAGSDVASPWVIPGVGFHQELRLLADAGLPARAVLASATRNAAAALGELGRIGSVETGKEADLVVLSADPLANIGNTRRIEYVVARGKVYQPAELFQPPSAAALPETDPCSSAQSNR